MITNIDEYVKRGRRAFEQISDYTQEQVDKLVYECAKVIYKNAVPLAEMAVEETRLGCVEDKIAKNTDTPTVFWSYLKDKKSVGIIGEIPEQGIIEVAHPVGVIAAITPATNPTVTPLGNFLHALKGKNALIVSSAPRAQKTSTKTVDLIRETLAANGAPADLLQILDVVTIENSAALMAACDMVLATGSFGLTKAAYSSGTPAYGVGPGNPPVILDRGYDVKKAAAMTFTAVGSDNGILCDGDNLLLYPQDCEKEFFDALRAEGIIIYEDKAEAEAFAKALFIDGKSNPELVGKDANVIAQAAGVDMPENTKVFAIKLDVVGSANILNKEIMGPVVILKSYDSFEEAVDLVVQNMTESGGVGHTAGLFSNDDAHIRYAGEKIPVARLLVNQPSPDAWGPATNGLSPAVSESCGSWGNNILCGNVDYIHLINVSRIALPLDVEVPDGEKIFAD
ncbi:MAG: aldehyde dehydrogenase family protein [Lachnospiraceae bacterium]|nr:aldehyde dehydrogenase family protein [Lachnospiraceae bacterium]